MLIQLTNRQAAWLRSLVQKAMTDHAELWSRAHAYFNSDMSCAAPWRAAMRQAEDNLALSGLLLDKLRQPILLPWKPKKEEAEEDDGEEWKDPVA